MNEDLDEHPYTNEKDINGSFFITPTNPGTNPMIIMDEEGRVKVKIE